MTIAVRCHPVFVGWNEARLLHLTVHADLELLVKPLSLTADVIHVRDLDLHRDTERVTAVARKTELLGVVRHEFHCHLALIPF
jgi:hypothetical protein